jgi:hypothetical protein
LKPVKNLEKPRDLSPDEWRRSSFQDLLSRGQFSRGDGSPPVAGDPANRAASAPPRGRAKGEIHSHSREGGNPMSRQYYVYILASRRSGTLHIGMTNNLSRRVWDHRQGRRSERAFPLPASARTSSAGMTTMVGGADTARFAVSASLMALAPKGAQTFRRSAPARVKTIRQSGLSRMSPQNTPHPARSGW